MAQAELVRTNQVSPAELVGAAVERIEAATTLNAVIHERFERALAEAQDAPPGPFRGVPLLLKDLGAAFRDEPMYCGTRFLREADWRPRRDSVLVERFRNAGFVVVGRTNVPELGTTVTTEPRTFGPSRNPWDLGRSVGGSSGGSAAAVAAGLVAIAHGNDGGGSIRVPASMNGIVGFKPTRARITHAPELGEAWAGAATDSVLTRSVRDAATALDCISGGAPGDPYPAPVLPGPLALEVGQAPGTLRIGLLDHPAMEGVQADPDAGEAVRAAGALLESLGHHVEEAWPVALSELDFASHFVTAVGVAVAVEVESWGRALGRRISDDELEARNVSFATAGRAISATQYVASRDWLHGFSRRMASWWADGGFDILVCPVINSRPFPLGWLSDESLGLAREMQILQYTSQFNVTGQPAVSLPLHWDSEGLPIGVQLVASFGREDLLVRLSSQLEQACPWSEHVPPVHY